MNEVRRGWKFILCSCWWFNDDLQGAAQDFPEINRTFNQYTQPHLSEIQPAAISELLLFEVSSTAEPRLFIFMGFNMGAKKPANPVLASQTHNACFLVGTYLDVKLSLRCVDHLTFILTTCSAYKETLLSCIIENVGVWSWWQQVLQGTPGVLEDPEAFPV